MRERATCTYFGNSCPTVLIANQHTLCALALGVSCGLLCAKLFQLEIRCFISSRFKVCLDINKESSLVETHLLWDQCSVCFGLLMDCLLVGIVIASFCYVVTFSLVFTSICVQSLYGEFFFHDPRLSNSLTMNSIYFYSVYGYNHHYPPLPFNEMLQQWGYIHSPIFFSFQLKNPIYVDFPRRGFSYSPPDFV